MMLRERWLVAGVVGLGLLSAAVLSPGQAPAGKPKVVQPDSGAPPEQAVPLDQTAPLDQTMPPDPGLPPEEDIPPELAKPDANTAGMPPAAAPEPPKEEPQQEEAKKPEAQAPEPARVAGTPAQQQLEKDAATLLQLTEELKAEVEKAGSNTLSLAALRKADEVQKLSRNLKEKMKDLGQAAVSK